MSSKMIHDLGYEVLAFKQTGYVVNKINSIIFRDQSRKEIIVAFSGTKDPIQLVNEVVDNWPTKYELHDISGALVLGYFYRSYSEFADWLEDTLSAIENKYDYTTIFTGHSLGGALAVHAAIDMLLENISP